LLLFLPYFRFPILLSLSLLSLSASFLVFSFYFISFSSSLFLFISFPLLSFSLSPFVFAILTSLALVSTAYYISLNILLSSLFLFSSQSQDCGKQTAAFPKLHSTSNY